MIPPIGYFKVYRELFSKPIWYNSNSKQKTILMTLIAMANWKESEWEHAGIKYTALPGQFITSVENIATTSGKDLTNQNVRTSLKRFESLGFLTIKTTNKNTLVTINNWALYQEDNIKSTKKSTKSQQSTNNQLTNKLTTIEEDKEDKEIKERYIVSQNLSMTKSEYDTLVDKFGKQIVDDKIDDSRNWKKLNTYTSLYLTINKWLLRDYPNGNKQLPIMNNPLATQEVPEYTPQYGVDLRELM
jgi:hypothetical protein